MKDSHIKTILEFYDANAEFTRNDRYSDSFQTVYTRPNDEFHWLVAKSLDYKRLEIHQTDKHGLITTRDTYESQGNTFKCLCVERLQMDDRHMIQFTADEEDMVYQFGENGKSCTLAMLNQVIPRIKDPTTKEIVSQIVSKLSSLAPEVCSMLISSINNRKNYERDASVRERLAKAKEDTKHTVTTVVKTKGKEQRRHGAHGEQSL